MWVILLLLTIGLTIWFPIYRHKQSKSKNIKGFGRGLATTGLTIAIFILGIFVSAGAFDHAHPDNEESSKPKISKSKNIPGQKLNKSLAKKHEFYWTSKEDSKLRYFVNDGKITAVKYVMGSEQNNTFWCQAILSTNILHDKNLKYTDDKKSESDVNLANDKEYNVYSTKTKKWYRVSFNPGEGDKVSSFSVYPGKKSVTKKSKNSASVLKAINKEVMDNVSQFQQADADKGEDSEYAWSTYIKSVDYTGDGQASVYVTKEFLDLSNNQRDEVANHINNEITADAYEHKSISEDDSYNGVFLVFYTDKYTSIGRNEYTNYKEYKWDKD